MTTLKKFTSGIDTSFTSQLNGNTGIFLTNQLQSYLSLTTRTYMVKQDATSSAGLYRQNLLHNGSNWYTPDYSKAFYVDIYAASITAIADFEINGCKMMPMSATSWRLINDVSATKEVNKANVLKTLFDDGQSGGARAKTTYITSLVIVRTPDTNLTARRFYYVKLVGSSGSSNTYTGTFADTLSNTQCQAWTRIVAAHSNDSVTLRGVTVNTQTNSGTTATIDETTIDTSSERQNNPTTIVLNHSSNNGGTAAYTLDAFFSSFGSVSFGTSGTGTGSNVDFQTTHGVPAFSTNSDDEVTVLYQSANLATITTAVTAATCWANTNVSPTAKFSCNGGTNFSADAQGSLQSAPATGTDLRMKIEWTRGSNTSADTLSNFAIAWG